MDFADRIIELSQQVAKLRDSISTEEATKNAFVMPFIKALGYDVFNPIEVVPEFVADVGIKKGEKVDYAIMKDDKPIIIFEAKTIGTNLKKVHASQLHRYFHVTDVRFSILTNGVQYHFFSDIEQPNRMDENPFFVIDLMDIKPSQIVELKQFTKESFDEDAIVSVAGELKYARAIKSMIAKQLTEPDEDFVKFVASQVYTGRVTQSVRALFSEITRKALKQFINERVTNRLQSALETNDTEETPAVTVSTEQPVTETVEIEEIPPEEKSTSREITTTEDEIEGYFIVKSILREVVGSKRIVMRDTKSYCGILLDDNNRKPLCRLHFNRTQKYLGMFDKDKNEERVPIDDLDQIFEHADRLKETPSYYED